MKNQKPKSKPKNAAKKEASGGQCDSPCSPSFVRMVVQVSNTPENRKAVERLAESAKIIIGPIQGNFGVIKLETVTLESWSRSRSIFLPNVRALAQPRETSTNENDV